MAINFDKAFGIHQQAMLLRAERAGILANNLANADTPNFKARDIDFRAEFQRAADTRGEAGLKTTNSRHIQPHTGPGGYAYEMLFRVPLQPSLDGNTVDTNTEQAAIMKNSMHYQASLRFLSGKVKGMMTALRGE